MISNDLIHTDISTLQLIYGEMKNRMYETQCAMEDEEQRGLREGFQREYLEGLMDAYGFVYSEIDRIMNARGEK